MPNQYDDKPEQGPRPSPDRGAPAEPPIIADVGAWLDEWDDLRVDRSQPARETRQLPAFNLGTPPERLARQAEPGVSDPPADDPPVGPVVSDPPVGPVVSDPPVGPVVSDPSIEQPAAFSSEPPVHDEASAVPPRVPSPPPIPHADRQDPLPIPGPDREAPPPMLTGVALGTGSAGGPEPAIPNFSGQVMVRSQPHAGTRPIATSDGRTDDGRRKLGMAGVEVSVDTGARGLVVAGMLVCCAFLGLFGYLLGRSNAGDVTTGVAATETSTTVMAPDLAIGSPAPPQTPSELAAATVQLIGLDGERQPVCAGSGFLVDERGTILTNAHVVVPTESCDFSRVGVAVTEDINDPPDLLYAADVVAVDDVVDLAVVRIVDWLDDDRNEVLPAFDAVALGTSDSVELGDDIRIYGYPVIGGETITSTAGTVSGFTSQVGVGRRALIKTDAAISAGNSGGLAVNTDGQVIGIPTRARASESGPPVDCRALADTNEDGAVDDQDVCVPVGGFLNGIRPIDLAKDLLSDSTPPPPSSVEVDWGLIDIRNPRFSSGVTEANWPVDTIVTATAGIRELCLFVDWQGIPDDVAWDSVWTRDGESIPDFAIRNQRWDYGDNGLNFWLCAGDDTGLEAGVYEVGFFINEEMVFAEGFEVTGAPAEVYDVVWVNDSGSDVCSLSINPLAGSRQVGVNQLPPNTVLGNGESQIIRLAAGRYAVEALDCDGAVVADESDAAGLLVPGPDDADDGSVVFVIGAD